MALRTIIYGEIWPDHRPVSNGHLQISLSPLDEVLQSYVIGRSLYWCGMWVQGFGLVAPRWLEMYALAFGSEKKYPVHARSETYQSQFQISPKLRKTGLSPDGDRRSTASIRTNRCDCASASKSRASTLNASPSSELPTKTGVASSNL